MTFWDQLPRPFLALAPMEDVTDVIFRRVVVCAGRPDVFFTEFTNAASFCSKEGELSTRGRLTFTESEQPIVAQIWGNKPEDFAEMAQALAKRNFVGIDINMGCPDKKVVKSGSGATLITKPDLARELIVAAQTSKLPISVKTRLGYLKIDEWQPWLAILLEQNLANLAVHLRTKKEMSKVPAHFELIPEIVALRDKIAPNTKLTINGDIHNRAHAMELWHKHPGVDGFMIGRGVFNNPFCFTDTAHPTHKQLFDLLNYHLDQFDKFHKISPDHERKFEPLKRFFKVYVKDFPGAAEFRAKLFECKTTNEVREVLMGAVVDNDA
ncbi:MAG: tRNA-dihydrouridine synthase family protein [Candidatus Nomurabacteria bacterium]|jgi:tRNA-dihydrouridine synthase|nr:tRNA-dihydrouridine synthase family protein [Candidatus Nomurabacteria bacterium]